jgi:hypothetical protein
MSEQWVNAMALGYFLDGLCLGAVAMCIGIYFDWPGIVVLLASLFSPFVLWQWAGIDHWDDAEA